MVLHGDRPAFAALWHRFCSAQPWWQDADARLLFELDLVGKPFLYKNTPIDERSHAFQQLRIIENLSRGYLLDLPAQSAPLLAEFGREHTSSPQAAGRSLLRVEHPRIHYPYNPAKREEDIADYCSGMITRVTGILPTWSQAST